MFNKLFHLNSLNITSTRGQNCYLNMKYIIMYISYCKYSNQQPFKGDNDRFNGVTVDSTKEKCEPQKFAFKLEESLNTWFTEGKRCIWFKVNIKDSFQVPLLAQKGFNFHHARDDFVMMYKWLPKDSEPNLPPSCYTNVGVGAMVFNNKNQILAISEKHYNYPHWKLPGGYVDKGEDIIDAAIREVKEETGIDSTFTSFVTFRHSHDMMFGNSDIYVLVTMKALSEKIVVAQRELNECKWMEMDEYNNHPHIHEFNKMVVRKALEYKQRNLKLNIKKNIVKWGPYTRDMNFIIIESYNNK